MGKYQSIVKIADNHLFNSAVFIAGPYVGILKMINPHAKLPDDLYGEGFISKPVFERISDKAKNFSKSNNFLERHVASRLTYAILAISCVVSRVVDAIIGVSAAALSILTVGKFSSINNIACHGLEASAVIHDLFFCVMKFINPNADINPDENNMDINPDENIDPDVNFE